MTGLLGVSLSPDPLDFLGNGEVVQIQFFRFLLIGTGGDFGPNPTAPVAGVATCAWLVL